MKQSCFLFENNLRIEISDTMGRLPRLKSPRKTTVDPNQRKRLWKKKEIKKKREWLERNNMAPSCVIEWLSD